MNRDELALDRDAIKDILYSLHEGERDMLSGHVDVDAGEAADRILARLSPPVAGPDWDLENDALSRKCAFLQASLDAARMALSRAKYFFDDDFPDGVDGPCAVTDEYREAYRAICAVLVCPVCGGHGIEEVYGGHGTVLEIPCSRCAALSDPVKES